MEDLVRAGFVIPRRKTTAHTASPPVVGNIPIIPSALNGAGTTTAAIDGKDFPSSSAASAVPNCSIQRKQHSNDSPCFWNQYGCWKKEERSIISSHLDNPINDLENQFEEQQRESNSIYRNEIKENIIIHDDDADRAEEKIFVERIADDDITFLHANFNA
jgi:hypothetical protein